METKPLPEPKKPSKLLTEYYGLIFFLLVLVFLAAAAFGVKPKLDGLKQTNARITVELERLENERHYLDSLDQSIAAAQSIAPGVLGQVEQALPRKKGIPELLVLLGGTADKDGVKITNVTFSEIERSEARATSTVGELSISLNVTAKNYPQIKKFIRDLEASLRLLDITGINVSTQGKESAYAMQMKTYVYGHR